MANRSAVKIGVVAVCGVLTAALLTLLGLILWQAVGVGGIFRAPGERVYDGPVLADAEFRAVLLGDGAFDEENPPESVLACLGEIGANAVVFDGSEETLSALLSAAAAMRGEDAAQTSPDVPAVYALYRLLGEDAAVTPETSGALADELRAFALGHEGLAGIVFTDYTVRNTDALYDWFSEDSQEGFEAFVSRIEGELLASAQKAVKDARDGTAAGALVRADTLALAVTGSAQNDFILLDAALGGSLPSSDAARAWTAYSGTEKPVYAVYPSAVTFRGLEDAQQPLSDSCKGYLLNGLPQDDPEEETSGAETSAAPDVSGESGAASEPQGASSSPEPSEAAASSESTGSSISAPPSSEADGPETSAAQEESASGTETSVPETPPEEGAEPGIEGEKTPEVDLPLTEAHERTLRLLAGLTDPAGMELFYLPEDLLSDRLILNRPLSNNSSGTASSLLFTGIVPLGSTVTLDGEPVELDRYGHFHYDVPLVVGANIIYLKVDDQTYTFYYTRNVINVLNYSPMNGATVDGGGEVPVWITARSGSEITAELDGTVVSLTAQNSASFPTYTGSIPLPEGGEEQKTLGNVIFRITYDGATQVVTGGAITLNSTAQTLPERIAVRAQDSKYKDDGCAAVYPVVPYGAHAPELLDFDAAADSNWEFSPLPDGTVDAVTGRAVYAGVEYYILSSGLRIAAADTEPVELSGGSNEISALTVLNDGDFTHLVFEMSSPVVFQLDYSASEVRVAFSDTVSVPENLALTKTPLFTAARWVESTLVLPLRTKEGFLGYVARYEGSRLILSCTNPPASGSVEGARIVVDPGHGGFAGEQSDAGAVGAGMLDEAQFNYYIGCYLADYLTELGAVPVVTPSDTEYLTIAQRLDRASVHRASMNLSIHHNSSNYGSVYGVGTYYYQNASEPLAALVQREVSDLHTASIRNGGDHDNGLYHTRYMFTLRTGWLSLMLEDGFVCNGPTYSQLIEPEFQASVAKAVASAVAEYYERYDAVKNWPTGIERAERG